MSQDDEARAQILALTARSMAVRDIVARMLAYEAKRSSDPMALLQNYSDHADGKLERAEKASPELIETSETLRAETDWILVEAKALLDAGLP